MYHPWHDEYFAEIEKAVKTATVNLVGKGKFENDLDLFPSAKATFPKGLVKIQADELLKEWRSKQEAGKGADDLADREEFVNKVQRKMIRMERLSRIRADLRAALKRSKRAPAQYILHNHRYLSHAVRGLRWIVKARRMFSFMMQEFIIPKYANNIQAFVTYGAAGLIVSIGARAINSEDIPAWVIYAALALEATLLFIYGTVIFFTSEEEHAAAAAKDDNLLNAVKAVNTNIEQIGKAVTSLDDAAIDRAQLKAIKQKLEETLTSVNKIL